MMNLKSILRKTWIYKHYFKFRYNSSFYFILRNLFRDIDTLEFLYIETVSHCNRKCVFCPVAFDKSPGKFMEEKIFYKIIDNLVVMKFNGLLNLSNYGEPLLDRRLLKFVKYAKEKLNNDVKIEFFSNGDLLTTEKAKEFLRNGVDIICISQHDLEPSRQISELKKHNWGGKIVFGVVNANSKGLSNRAGSVDVNGFNPIYCRPDSSIIRADGTVCLCCNDYYNEVSFGNVKKKSLEEIWNNDSYRKIRKKLKHGNFDLQLCKRCRGVGS